MRNNAEGAVFVASLNDRHHALVGTVATDRVEIEDSFFREADRIDFFTRATAGENFAQLPNSRWPHDKVEIWNPLEGPVSDLLGHAPAKPDQEIGVGLLEQAIATETRKHLVLGFLANTARVEQDYVGLLDPPSRHHSLPNQLSSQSLAVELVHLAAPGLDEELAALTHGGSEDSGS